MIHLFSMSIYERRNYNPPKDSEAMALTCIIGMSVGFGFKNTLTPPSFLHIQENRDYLKAQRCCTQQHSYKCVDLFE